MSDWELLLLSVTGLVGFWLAFFWFVNKMLEPKIPDRAAPKPMNYPVRIRPRRQKNYLCEKHVASPKILGILYVLDNAKCDLCKKGIK